MGTVSMQWQQTMEETQRIYDNHMNNTLWSLHNAKRMLQKLKRTSQGGERAKYERMIKRLTKVQDAAYTLLLDVFETEDDDDALSLLPCGCHHLPPLACAAARAHANPFAPWDGPVCDCACHARGVVVNVGKGDGT